MALPTLSRVTPGWQYRTFRWNPDLETCEAWATRLRDEGWQTWAGNGAWATIDGRRVFGVTVRRMVDKPWGRLNDADIGPRPGCLCLNDADIATPAT